VLILKRVISLLITVVIFVMVGVSSYAQVPDKYEYKVTLDSVKSVPEAFYSENLKKINWKDSTIVNGRFVKVNKEETFIIPNLYTTVKIDGKYFGKLIYTGSTKGYKLYSGVADKITKTVKVTVKKQSELPIVGIIGSKPLNLENMFSKERENINFNFTFTIKKVKVNTPTPSVSPSASTSPSVSPTVSTSPSVSPTASTSPSVSPSVSTSPSVSPSVSTSPSASSSVVASKTEDNRPNNLSYAVVNIGKDDDNDNDKDNTTNISKDSKVYSDSLPKTGESSNKLPLIGGLISFLGMVTFIILKKK
jgi:LPXTG-motif cell wall-anchored protein